ncbi:hypothetical protein GE061_018706 [Apolygus lucorum]|uniref:Uncharacterized protein n=1 Tax=Apolygus lucorum TaxID=248454 RepID=A0A8S9X905_APOLU|nr:hypothetical protein GE061_018706 [Apolygus lucorum]
MWQPKMNPKAFILTFALVASLGVSSGASDADVTTATPGDCGGADCQKANATTFTPPPADSMSRLMPSSSQVVTSNDTKDPAASNVDVVTTPDTGSLGLSSYSSFSQGGQQGFSPSPFLGVISETHINSYPQGLAVGEVFPDTVGDRHQGGHKYLYSIAGQSTHHTGHSYHDQATRQRPTPLTATDSSESFLSTPGTPEKISYRPPSLESLKPTVETSYGSFTYSPHKGSSSSSLTSSTKSLGYPVFEIPDRFKEFKDISNSITDYKPPSPVAFPSFDKPIREDLFDDKPDAFPSGAGGPVSGPDAFGGHEPPSGVGGFGLGGPPGPAGFGGLPPPPAFTSPPALFKQKGPGIYKGGKWGKGFYKVLASLIPLGLLIAAFTPNLLVVNGTEDPAAAPLVEATPAPPLTQSQVLQNSQYPPVQVQSQPPVLQSQSIQSAEWTKIPTWNPTVTTKTSYRSLESALSHPEIPAGLEMTQCQKKKVCEALVGVDDSYKSFVDSLVFRAGKSFKEAVDLAKENNCMNITCVT